MTELEQRTLDNLAELKIEYPGAIAISAGRAFLAIGGTNAKNYTRAAKQAIAADKFPFSVIMHGTKPRVMLTEIAAKMAIVGGGVPTLLAVHHG